MTSRKESNAPNPSILHTVNTSHSPSSLTTPPFKPRNNPSTSSNLSPTSFINHSSTPSTTFSRAAFFPHTFRTVPTPSGTLQLSVPKSARPSKKSWIVLGVVVVVNVPPGEVGTGVTL